MILCIVTKTLKQNRNYRSRADFLLYFGNFLAFPAPSPVIYRSRAGLAICFGIACLLFLLPHLSFTEVGQVWPSASVSLACFSCSLACLLPKYSRFGALLRYRLLAFPAPSPVIYRSRAGLALCFGIAYLLFLLPHLSFTEVQQVSRSASVVHREIPTSEAVLYPRQR